jgi:hypothetical protein
MKTTRVVLCVLLGLLFKRSTLAADLTLYTNNTNMRKWPSLTYDVAKVNLCRGELKFKFKTFVEDAIVLYQDDRGESNFISIILHNGHLHVIARIGKNNENNTTLKLKVLETYSDFKWHSVGIRLNCPQPCFEITIDDVVHRKIPRSNVCKFKTNLQIGGFTSARLDYRNSISSKGLRSQYFKVGVR